MKGSLKYLALVLLAIVISGTVVYVALDQSDGMSPIEIAPCCGGDPPNDDGETEVA